nr:hypothetical protein [Mycoplasmopsis bovis]
MLYKSTYRLIDIEQSIILDTSDLFFSPYGDRYKKFDKEKELYEKVHNELGSWIARIQNNNPEKLLKFKFPEAGQIH